jgi:hypothetical protein
VQRRLLDEQQQQDKNRTITVHILAATPSLAVNKVLYRCPPIHPTATAHQGTHRRHAPNEEEVVVEAIRELSFSSSANDDDISDSSVDLLLMDWIDFSSPPPLLLEVFFCFLVR